MYSFFVSQRYSVYCSLHKSYWSSPRRVLIPSCLSSFYLSSIFSILTILHSFTHLWAVYFPFTFVSFFPSWPGPLDGSSTRIFHNTLLCSFFIYAPSRLLRPRLYYLESEYLRIPTVMDTTNLSQLKEDLNGKLREKYVIYGSKTVVI